MSNQDYYQKYIKYKQKYINLKSNDIILQGGGKKCTIEETDKVLFGDGGSSAIIVIDRKSTRLNSSHVSESRMPSSA